MALTNSEGKSNVNETAGIAVEKEADYTGTRIGMWLFLFTEMLLFGGMFLLYSVYRSMYPQDFHSAANELNVITGTVNTIILITSSLTMAISTSAAQKGHKGLSIISLALTILLGLLFLINKYLEWGDKFQHGIYPNSAGLLRQESGNVLFYGLYFVMTGLHGLHVLAGVILLSVMLILLLNKRNDGRNYIKLENSGLYWHLVDIVWIFIFPLFYLIT